MRNTKKRFRSALPAAFAAVLLAGALPAQVENQQASLSDEQKEEFLLKGKVVRTKGIPEGITQTSRLTMTAGDLTHDAHFQAIDVSKSVEPLPSGPELNFRDCYKFNIAAYKLDRMLGMNMVPVSVERKVSGKSAAITWWVDDVQMMEKERYLKKIPVPPQQNERWNSQMFRIRVFNELTYNTDPNLGNLLITKDWDLWAIDYSRGFRAHKKIRMPENLTKIDRELLERLRALDEQKVRQELGTILRKPEVDGLLARRDLIVTHFDKAIAEKGEAAVLVPAPVR